MSEDAFVLGAGFSLAASPFMPLTDELGQECASLVPDPRVPANFTGGRFETWLSELAEIQPYLNEQSNLDNQALFTRFSRAISMVLEARTLRALSKPWLPWLPVFIKAAHYTRSTVVTFNYDTLIECAVATGLLFDHAMAMNIAWYELTGDVPSWPPGPMNSTPGWPAETLRLLKLHGSLNWYWVPGDESGATVARRDLPGIYGAPEPYTEGERQRRLPGRVPLIVPPSAAKSSYYRNPITREMWQQAATKLGTADRVVIMGYSLPLTDLTFGSMFRRAVVERDVPIVVVDPSSADVAERITKMGAAPDRITEINGADAIAIFTKNWARELGTETIRDLASDGDPSAPMAVGWGPGHYAHVRSLESRDDVIVLHVGPLGSWEQVGRLASAPGQVVKELPTLADVLAAGRPLQVETNGVSQFVISHSYAESETGYPGWHVLHPDGPRPNPFNSSR